MKKWLVLMGLITTVQMAFCCGNAYGYTLDGQRIFTRYFYLSDDMMQFDTVRIQQELSELVRVTESGKADYKTGSNMALNLMKLGRADSALRILIPLHKEFPKEYNLVANMGTAYELVGELDSALKYISLGYEMDATSHLGTEWVHVKILQAKIKERNTPGWLRKHRVVEVAELVARLDSNLHANSIRHIDHALFYQIRTRVPFTPAPNKIIANLLLSLGDLNVQKGTYENALLCYTYALKFEESSYRDRKIKTKIRKLNQSRLLTSNATELAPMFIRMMNRSQLDPDILLMGIDDFANQLEAKHRAEISRDDSMHYLHARVDEVVHQNRLMMEQAQVSDEVWQWQRYFYLLGGVLLGALLVFMGAKWFKK